MKTHPIFSLLVFIGALMAGTTTYAEEKVKSNEAPLPPSGAEQSAVDAPLVIDHVVYLAKLPVPDELMRSAELKATPIIRMDQTADRIVAVYQHADGRTVTFAFVLLSAPRATRNAVSQSVSNSSYAEGPSVSSSRYEVVTPTPAPSVTSTVVYVQPEPVYYYPSVRYYDSAWDFWAPFAVGVGLGWGGGHYYGHGGYRGHGGGYSHGHR